MTCLAFLLLSSCKKFVESDIPKTAITGATVFSSDATANAAIVGLYSRMNENLPGFFNGGLTLYTGFSSDELTYSSTDPSYTEFYQNALTPGNSLLRNDAWAIPYQCIYHCNAIIENLEKSPNVTPSTKLKIVGEAKFIRALCHFYLVNLFGDIPLITTTDYAVNSLRPRSARQEVYAQIIKDLMAAKDDLADSYTGPDRVRPNKYTAIALLSRVYLYNENWQQAATEASSIINNTSQYQLVSDLDKVFVKSSTETIWQLMPVIPNLNTAEGYLFSQLSNVPLYGSLSDSLVASFETGDQRKFFWTREYTGSQIYFIPNKYKVGVSNSLTEYNIVFRLAEQYLIRAEARAQLNNMEEAIEDVNVIRSRAGLDPITGSLSKTEVLALIEKERKAELFTEWGHRWMDLKRTGHAQNILQPIKGINWQASDTLYPLPLSEIQNNPNLHQNPGY